MVRFEPAMAGKAHVFALAGIIVALASGPSAAASAIRYVPGAAPLIPLRPAVTPVAWCGDGASTVNRSPELELSSHDQIHVVYAIPSDGADAFAANSSPIATDIGAIDAWWQRQDPSRTPRFDLFAFPTCSSRFGDLDLGFARLPHPGSFYLGDERGILIGADLAAFAASDATKNIVYYDGPVSDGNANVCGTTYFLANTAGGQFGFAFVWLRSACPNDLGKGNLLARVAAHELVHNLGAEPDVGPPHACPDHRGHPCDSSSDLLYPFVTSTSTLDEAVLDVNRDDYYGHSGSWWDVQDSAWLMHLPQYQLTVSVTASAGTTGAVEMHAPAAVMCSQSCSTLLDNGTTVALAGAPAVGARLVSWGGACSGSGTCTLTMDGPKDVSAVFGPATFRVSTSVAGRGKIVSSPAGISCPRACSAGFAADARIVLRAKPAKNYRFVGWSGDCRGRGACTLLVDRRHAVRATFRRR
jgi:hypothetical protein